MLPLIHDAVKTAYSITVQYARHSNAWQIIFPSFHDACVFSSRLFPSVLTRSPKLLMGVPWVAGLAPRSPRGSIGKPTEASCALGPSETETPHCSRVIRSDPLCIHCAREIGAEMSAFSVCGRTTDLSGYIDWRFEAPLSARQTKLQ